MPDSDVDLRSRVVTGAVAAYRSGDFHSVGLAEVARAAGLGEDDVRRAYPLWDLLIVAVMDRWNNGSRRALWSVAERDGVVAYLRARLQAGLDEPALVRLRIALLSAASTPGHPAEGWFRAQYARSFEDITLGLTRDVVAGREPRGASPRHAAEQLVALYEGLQLQAVLRDDTEPLGAFDRAVARLRAGWSTVPV
ncbi:TetR family transcriptional regulator C-terminal domain-containing protein [Curtobacterium sp. 1P10AnD]|uniref:TetR/AcrR family transcriptional regulator n=1 Tax=Curtobacterium sp. 1P10AnD TaxID=3132283 RepID=UPI0039A29537